MSITNWSKENVTNFYKHNRKSIKELYPSEKLLLSKVEKNTINSIIDFGCATGNFKHIFRKLYGSHIYLGVDADKNMIDIAKKINLNNPKEDNFLIKKDLKNINQKFDLVFSTGTLNHIKNYKSIVKQMFSISNKYIFFDAPRMSFRKNFIAKMNLTKRFESEEKENLVNYYIENIKNFIDFIKKLFFNDSIEIYLYINELPYSKKYLNIRNKIYYCTVLIVKNPRKKSFKVISNDKKIIKFTNDKFK